MFNMRKKKKLDDKSSGVAVSYGRLRLQEDIKDLETNDSCTFRFPNKDDLMNFEVTLCQTEGFYSNAYITFSFEVPDNYPHTAPKVKCLTPILHPNMDSDGNICLNILREDWTPVLSINSIICGLQYLLTEPSVDDPLNETAARLFKMNKLLFEKNVQQTLDEAGAFNKKN